MANNNEDNILRASLHAGDPKKIAALIEQGADIRYKDENGYDALVDAVHGRDILRDPHLIELLKLLITSGVSLKGMTTYGESGVRELSRIGRFDAVQLLLKAGANHDDIKFTKLIEAVVFGSLADVTAVVISGVDLQERDYWERTPWLFAIQIGDIDKATLLLEHGVDRNARGRCGKFPLCYAIENYQAPMLKWLLDMGTDIEQTDDFGQTALRSAVECQNEEAVEILLARGANVNQESEMGTALGSANTRNIALRLIDAGAHPKHLTSEGRRAILGFPSEPNESLLKVSANEFQLGRSRRFGRHNPEKMNVPFWEGMIRAGINAYQGGKLFGDERECVPGYVPIWCAQRFGQSITFLPDGRIVQVAGEHEDSYDPDFCIYNDVFVHDGSGNITIYGYPETVFPPTDFHTATLIGSHIYLIGSLGYSGTRRYGETPIYRLNINSFRMERLETSGNNPGWIYEHRAIQAGDHAIEVKQGTIVTLAEGEENYAPNTSSFVLDIERLVWRVKE